MSYECYVSKTSLRNAVDGFFVFLFGFFGFRV
jgi:hypothetical protein